MVVIKDSKTTAVIIIIERDKDEDKLFLSN